MIRPTCKTKDCINLCKTNGFNKNGFRKYHKYCSQCCKRKHKQVGDTFVPTYRTRTYLRKYGEYVKLPHCQACGFIAEQSVQLDVDHIDGDNSNNTEKNLQTLCSNCHRLKTFYNKDYLKQKTPD